MAEEAKRLAEKYGADADKAYISGLLHDITKNADKREHFALFKSANTELTPIERSTEKLWHAMSGVIFVKNNLGINDGEILSAIRYHTTARADMTLLEKILYLADFTSADRDYDDVDVMRRMVDESLESAMIYALSYTIKELIDKRAAIHPDTTDAYNQTVLKEQSYVI